MTKDEALRLALEALEDYQEHIHRKKTQSAITAIKAILSPQNELEAHWNEMRASFGARQAALETKNEPWEQFCDSHCVWTDHHPDCKLEKQEPVAWLHRFIEGGISIGLKPLDLERHPERWEPLYTTPPQRTWVGLTDKDWKRSKHTEDFEKGVDWAEAMLKAKNT